MKILPSVLTVKIPLTTANVSVHFVEKQTIVNVLVARLLREDNFCPSKNANIVVKNTTIG